VSASAGSVNCSDAIAHLFQTFQYREETPQFAGGVFNFISSVASPSKKLLLGDSVFYFSVWTFLFLTVNVGSVE
jgi:hypothetical protein